MALQSAVEQYRRQRRLTALAVRDARQAKTSAELAQIVNRYQIAAAITAEQSVPDMLAEQGIPDAPVAKVNPTSFASGGRVAEMAANAATNQAFDRLVATFVQDAGRGAASVAIAVRPNVHGHVRHLNPPSCSRCAILAGRFYRWSEGFRRHPRCDCVMVASNEEPAQDLITDPMEAFQRGQIRGLSKADTQAILDGGDLGRIVNVRRQTAGLVDGTSVLIRGGRLTPEGIYRVAESRDEAIAMLEQHRYTLPLPTRTASPLAPIVDRAVVRDMEGGSAERFLVRGTDGEFRFTAERQQLHDEIVGKIVSGHAKQESPSFVMLGGGPASGKTKAAQAAEREFADAIKIDPDAIKAMLPEYAQMTAEQAAGFVHEESSYISKRVMDAALESRAHIILDAVGNNSVESVLAKIEKARSADYGVHGRYVTIPTEEALARALARGIRSGRVVHPEVIEKLHSGVSNVFPQVMHEFDSAALYDNATEWKHVLSVFRGQPEVIHDLEAWRAFLRKAKGY